MMCENHLRCESFITKRLKWFGHVALKPADNYVARITSTFQIREQWPTVKEMVHPNPRGHRPTTGDVRTQNVRKVRLAERSHGESKVSQDI